MTAEILKLSIVVAARNDTHGGDFLGRMQTFVSGLGEEMEDRNIRNEDYAMPNLGLLS